MASSLQNKSDNIKITQSMLDNLDYDPGAATKITSQINGTEPLALFVFHQSDLDASAYYLAKSLEYPLNPGGIKCAFVQESCAEKFSGIIKAKLKPYSDEALKSQTLLNALNKSLDVISKLNAKTIRPDTKETHAATIVYDIPQEHFTADGPSPVVTLYTFRTAKEATALSKKENVLKSASIWCENHALGYEVISETALKNYYLNCCHVAWTPIQAHIAKQQPFAIIDNSYHYETLVTSGVQKNIVFPFGTSFAN